MPFQHDRYKTKVRLTNLFVMRHLKQNLMEYIELCHWKEDLKLCQNLINDTVTEQNKIYLNLKLRGLTHLRDRRTSEEYALDLILGWIVEDVMKDIFNKILLLKANLHSADRNREFLLKPVASSDFIINHNDQEWYVEIISDYTGFWHNYSVVHLRDDKFLNLKAEDGILLGIDYRNSRFLIFKVNSIESNRVRQIKEHRPYGGKPAYEISLKTSDFYQIEDFPNFLLREGIGRRLERTINS